MVQMGSNSSSASYQRGPSQLENLMTLANAGLTGYNQRKQKVADANSSRDNQILVALAQQGMVKQNPAGGWMVGEAPVNYANLENEQDYLSKKNDLENPDAAMQRKAMEKAMSDAMLYGKTEDVLNVMLAGQTAKTGMGPVDPAGIPGSGGFFGLGAKPPIATRKRILGNQIVTEYQSPDGVWSTANPKSKKDKFGYSVGESKDIPGKGTYTYLGNNQWQKQ